MAIRQLILLTTCLWIALLPIGQGEAAALRVAPILVDVNRGATSKIVLQNLGKDVTNVQIRIFKWVQKDGKRQLLKTRDVVASPPFAKIRPGKRNTIRVVRLSRKPLGKEESYRLLIDEIPSRKKTNRVQVGIALRYSLPVFFGTQVDQPSRLIWSVSQKNGETIVTARNVGLKRVRLVGMKLEDGKGRSLSFGKGLSGYVLQGSTKTWKRKGLISGGRKRGRVIITAQTEHGKIRSEAKLQTAH